MCEPRKMDVLEVVSDTVTGVATAVGTAAQLAVRFGCRWSSDGQLERGRWVLCWRFLIEAVVAAVTVYYLGRAAMWVFLGVAAASWLVGYLVHVELQRRHDLEPVDEAEDEPEIEFGPDGRPRLEAVS
jgi:hypothetical protein